MLKKFLLLLPLLALVGCTTSKFTRLTPNQQVRNPDNLYPVEVAFDSNQQALRWDSIKAFVVVNGQPIALRPVPLVRNRWEGIVSVPPSANSIQYKFKFDYLFNSFGKVPQPNSEASKVYTLKIVQ